MTPVSKETLEGLNAGISSEVAAYVFYIEAAKNPKSVEFKKILEDLALEEKRHFHILERQHHSLIKSEQWISLADLLKEKDLPEISEEMSSTHQTLIDQVRKANTAKEILDIAYQLEMDARDLFAAQVERAKSPEGKKIFTELSKFEATHMRKIDEMRKQYA